MVSESLVFISVLLCAILAQTVEVKAPKVDHFESQDEEDNNSGTSNSEDSDEDDELESEDEEDEPVYPSLSCLLFEDIGCRSECSILGSAFGYKKTTGICRNECTVLVSTFGIQKTTGDCDKDENICYCTVSRDNSLTSLWNDQFNSQDILLQIKKNENLTKKIQHILDDPFQTGQEAKENLKSVLSEEQYNKLKLNDNNAAAKMMKNGKLNSAVVKKHVAEKLPKTLKSADYKTLSSLNLKSVLFEALNEAKYETDKEGNEALNELVLDVRRTRNKTLDDILTEYVKKTQFKEPVEDETELSLFDYIVNYVIDELVKTKEALSKTSNVDDALQKNRFVLKNFDKNILQQSGPINKNWKGVGYKVHYERSEGGDIDIVWIQGLDEVRLQKSAGRDINQNWKFGNVYIKIFKDAGGNVNQTWNLRKSVYLCSKSAGGNINSYWSFGEPNEEMLETYQGLIDHWCRDNDFLMQRDYCVIYDECKCVE